ncbi:MAG: hypothetical protein J6I85_02095 [Clostridia bacterium]|nr:hypothetical protein [Clostridia bacterium]
MERVNKFNDKGITLASLVITIIVLLIIASIAIYYGTEAIKKANVENIRTNMLLINSKAKEYCEEANFRLGTGKAPEDAGELQTYLQPAENYLKEQLGEGNVSKNGNNFDVVINEEISQKMGLKNIDNKDKYSIDFNVIENSVVIKYNSKINDDDTKDSWTLSEVEEL